MPRSTFGDNNTVTGGPGLDTITRGGSNDALRAGTNGNFTTALATLGGTSMTFADGNDV